MHSGRPQRAPSTTVVQLVSERNDYFTEMEMSRFEDDDVAMALPLETDYVGHNTVVAIDADQIM